MDGESSSGECIGATVGERYLLVRLLGEGGMGAVYEAEHLVTRRHVALKLLHPGAHWSKNSVTRFVREAQIASSIEHPGVIEVLDAGTDVTGAPFLVFEMLRGCSVATLLDERRVLPIEEALAVTVELLDVLAFAHEKGVLHRDVKPDNLFLARSAKGGVTVKVLDFGISKVMAELPGVAAVTRTQTGTVMGTPTYMSPEQIKGESGLDGRADVWSAGVMLFEMLSGAVPFGGSNPNVVMLSVMSDPVPSLASAAPEVPESVCAVVHRAVEKNRATRIESAAAMAAALREAAAEQGLTLRLPTLPEMGEVRASVAPIDTATTEPRGAQGPGSDATLKQEGGTLEPMNSKRQEPRASDRRRARVVAGVLGGVGVVALVTAVAVIGARGGGEGTRAVARPSAGAAVVRERGVEEVRVRGDREGVAAAVAVNGGVAAAERDAGVVGSGVTAPTAPTAAKHAGGGAVERPGRGAARPTGGGPRGGRERGGRDEAAGVVRGVATRWRRAAAGVHRGARLRGCGVYGAAGDAARAGGIRRGADGRVADVPRASVRRAAVSESWRDLRPRTAQLRLGESGCSELADTRRRLRGRH